MSYAAYTPHVHDLGRNFWQLPPGTPAWMRPPDWMALGSKGMMYDESWHSKPHAAVVNTQTVLGLGNPGKLVGMMYDERTKQWIPVEAAAGFGNPGKIVGFNPDTGEMYSAEAGLGETDPCTQKLWLAVVAGATAAWLGQKLFQRRKGRRA